MTKETEKLVLEALQGLTDTVYVPITGQRLHTQIEEALKALDSEPAPTVEQVYGAPLDRLKAPKGFRFTGEFRVPNVGEHFMNSAGSYPSQCVRVSGYSNPPVPSMRSPRLILARVKRLVFDIVDEGRVVKPGEWFKTYNGPVSVAGQNLSSIQQLLPGTSVRWTGEYILSEPRVEEDQ